jgi:predicted PhzF superfamily epimerase YddE/YHI9
VAEPDRQRIAAELGFSETVFIDDPVSGRLRIYTPRVELPFAGHPTVGAAWLLAREGMPVDALRPPAGEVRVRYANGLAHVAARAEWAPPFECRQLSSSAEVRAMSASGQKTNTYAWAWIDEAAGTIRARAFVPDAGIAEDEATGSAAIALCAQLGGPITIHQGHGSVLLCRPLADDWVEVSGKVVLDELTLAG